MSEFAATPDEIERIDRAIYDLYRQEKALKKELELLNGERRALFIVRNLAISSIAPIHRLPDEILGEVFVAGTEGLVVKNEILALIAENLLLL